MTEKDITIGISRCLLGQGVRFDGGHKKNNYATNILSNYFELKAICPEVESGMTIPRPTIHLRGSQDKPILVEVMKPENDHTEQMETFSKNKVKQLDNLSGFILKSKSPTCGMERVKIYQETPKQPLMGVGLFAKELMAHYPLLPVEEEGRLNDNTLRENFIERIFVYHRWNKIVTNQLTAKSLLNFHTEHKLTLLAHHQQTYRDLGKELADLKGKDIIAFSKDYITKFMKGMKNKANRKSHTNVLMHIQGYFKNVIDGDDKAELKDSIERYLNGQLPLIVPITLLKHHLRRHQDPYLLNQRYLFPYPEELMLRNHI